ncbi:hypothetical protein EX30DRAFT_365451 [Ascodesmis nigricans]|uniref:Fanconi-associated nuclease n=1 Tax=Ascodesmis nigricans TaxID=341454 RepID=A0A4S2MPK7_9PEZI|nr:hypothetical protein EX30DRAFT_365451 [Ascodesmis nigricans]
MVPPTFPMSQIRSPTLPIPPAKRQKTSPSSSTPNPPADTDDDAPLPITDPTISVDELTAILPTPETPPSSDSSPAPRTKFPDGVYTTSIYVDAFNLALDTVLTDESYLFSTDELETFAVYRSLEYQAQYLYIRLFLRKTSAWFRVDKIHYPNDVPEHRVAEVCGVLQEVGFADGDGEITLEEAAQLVPAEQLKVLARDMMVTGAVGKEGIIKELKKVSKGQASLRSGGELGLRFDGKGRQRSREREVVERVLKETGTCIRLSSTVSTLFNRVHLVFYRSTEWSEKSLTTVILSRTMKRNFPSYIVCRTANIFPTRSALLDFEAAIKLQSIVDTHLESNDTNLQAVRDIFTSIYPLWQSLVASEKLQTRTATDDEAIERVYLRRFDAGWVYTRIIHKGVYVLGRFKEYTLEHQVLTALLAQPYFQPARRGVWYQRKALVEENYLAGLDDEYPERPEATLRKWRKRALETCEAGLRDPLCHVIYHYDLQKRVGKLERKLKVPRRERHEFGYAMLEKPFERVVYGKRINDSIVGQKSLWEDPATSTTSSSIPKSDHPLPSTPTAAAKPEYKQTTLTKTLHLLPPSPTPGIPVESLCLHHYHTLGWRGLHTESHLPLTLFSYLFLDLLFLPLPNIFQTAFQTAPLDLFTSAFYPCRASEINHRLVEISNGGAARIVREVWEREKERRPCVVGLDWGVDVEMLVEVCECIPGEALAVVCKVLCQEYRLRRGGMPDLLLWRVVERKEGRVVRGECFFAEVKSENDRLSDTQRMWIHVLMSAGVKVELCAVKNITNGKENTR